MEPIWERAVGEYIFDSEGKKYLDFTSGVMVANLGHANPEVVKEIKKAIDKQLLYCYRYPFSYKQQLKKELLSFTDNIFSEVCFATTGAEAIENSMMIATRYSEKHDKRRGFFISFSNSYHGKTLGAALLSDIKRYKSKTLETSCTALVKRLNFPTNVKEEKKVVRQLNKFSNGCIAIYIECIQGSTLLRASNSFLRQLRRLTTKNNILLIVDEIQTGFYRTGSKFSYLSAGIEPDMVCIGKGLTTTLPLSLVLLNKKLANYTNEALDASTHSSNPLSIAASVASLKVYRSISFKNKLERSIKSYAKMMDNLSKFVSSEVEVIYPGGVFGGLKFNLNPSQKYKIDTFVHMCRKRGLFLPLAIGQKLNIVKFTPPLIISKQQLVLAENIIIDVLGSQKLIRSRLPIVSILSRH